MKAYMKHMAVAALAVFATASYAQIQTGLDNGSFDYGNVGWAEQNGYLDRITIEVDSSGNKFASFKKPISIYDSFTIHDAGTYSISFWAQGSGATAMYDSMNLSLPFSQWVAVQHSEISINAGNVWKNYTYGFIASNEQSFHLYFDGSQTGLKLDNVGVSVAPVPEPETYAMLLAGLGVLGFTGRRRMKQG
ncbi:MAG: PEP-CTERM sorting domain-containing protein [Leptothrix sp. (in: b-proteobacteria)]